MIDIKQRIPAALQRARAAAGLSQEKLADALGISRSTVRAYEAGTTTPSLEASMEWCVACGYSLGQYLSDVYGCQIISTPDIEIERQAVLAFVHKATTEELHFLAGVIRASEALRGR
ncbi:MAG: helix-turn-helix domain-containing protein [Oscillospiraceae bacterium]|nr:helix-turn-helix domain-containing protein [Oscillospiraceae bacterium]